MLRLSNIEHAPAGAAATVDSAIAVAFVGTYGPRCCGIATFTVDLAAAVAASHRRVLPMVLAVTDPAGQYEYPSEVKFEIRQDAKADYARAAELVNYSDVRLVSSPARVRNLWRRRRRLHSRFPHVRCACRSS